MTSPTRKAEDMVSQTVSDVEHAARKAKRGAEQKAEELARQGRQASEQIGDVAGELGSALEDSVRRNPMTTLGMAAVAGFVIGALWKS